MPVRKEGRGSSRVLVIEGNLTLREISAIRDTLHASRGKQLRVSLEEVGEFDLSGVQLLYSLSNDERHFIVHAGRFLPRLRRMLAFAGLPMPMCVAEEASDG